MRQRAKALAAIRRYFDDDGFVEIEAPVLVPGPSVDVHLRPVPVGAGQWLITSPEFQMKRLVAGGLHRIYSICRCFRGDERGPLHSNEFSMLEWYRGQSDISAVIEDTKNVCRAVALATSGAAALSHQGRTFSLAEWRTATVAELMAEQGIPVRGDESADVLRERVVAAGVEVGTATAWDDVFFCAFLDKVEPALAASAKPVIVTEWPAPLAALARKKPGQPWVAERFEIYVGGVELANGFGELTCPVEQRARFEADNSERARRGLPVYPLDEKFLASLTDLPESGGVALGIDRLVMLAQGAATIGDVQAFGPGEL